MNVHRTKPERFPSLCLEHLFLTGFTIVPSLTISEDELWYMWCTLNWLRLKLIDLMLPAYVVVIHVPFSLTIIADLYKYNLTFIAI